MKQYEHDIAIAKQTTERFNAVVGLLKSALVLATVAGCVWMVVHGLVQIASTVHDSESLNAIAKIVKAFRLDQVAHWILTAMLGTGLVIERVGKKRAIREKGRFQTIAEAMDPGRTSSGLTPTGDSPRGLA